MNSFKINLEVIRRVRAQHNERFRAWYEIKKEDTTPMNGNGSKTSNSFDRVVNITSTS